ncbi:MAG: pectate lyase [Bacteroides sp.]|nr:pectate lyase [Bacteroides sp.]
MKYKFYKAMMFAASVLLTGVSSEVQAAKFPKNRQLKARSEKFFVTDEARRIGDQVLLYQRVTGGWPKNMDMCTPFTDEQRHAILSDKENTFDSTIDNNATTLQMAYLARLYNATGDRKYRDAVRRGIEFLLAGQYPSGGWPQFWPDNHGYQIHITYNDHAMRNTLEVIRDMRDGAEPYSADSDIVTPELRERLKDSFDRGIACILATQIRKDGKPTVWCQQHYRDTFLPAPARAYELPSYCSSESVGLVDLLMSLPEPDDSVKAAVHGAMAWLDSHKIMGYRYAHFDAEGRRINSTLLAEDGAGPIWARFYDLDEELPYVCDRDGVPRRHLDEIGDERRNGYGWYNDSALALYDVYDSWCRRHGETPVEFSQSGITLP